ncbi:MAG: hypothetical protein O3A51_03375 [Verrucomicrobia bacterium]|nr:hypothetical protein [Verrucomicrobiota bacterium]
MPIETLVLWIHILAMMGAFGGLLLIQIGMPRDARETASIAGVTARPATMLLAIGFFAGLYLYWAKIRYAANMQSELPQVEHIMIGTKFLLMVAAGAFMGATGKALKQGALAKSAGCRWLAILSLALAALIGVKL